MNYKLIEDKNGTIIDKKGERYKMSKLEYTKDDLIDLQNDYDLLYNKLDHYNKIINSQALEIARLKEENGHLKDLYKKTCEHLFNIGNDELARYFQAQILECPVFTPQIGDKE